jgi:uncharacterized OsmC-like protein
MSSLREYLVQKRDALLARRSKAKTGGAGPHTIAANVKAEGRSGVRRIRIRDHQILSDSPSDFAGYDFGPASPELQIGVLGSCLTHIFLIQAADRQVVLDSIDVDVTAQLDGRANQPGHEDIPVYPHNIQYTVKIESPASDQELKELHAAVERVCPILNLLVNPQQIAGSVVRTTGETVTSGVASAKQPAAV